MTDAPLNIRGALVPTIGTYLIVLIVLYANRRTRRTAALARPSPREVARHLPKLSAGGYAAFMSIVVVFGAAAGGNWISVAVEAALEGGALAIVSFVCLTVFATVSRAIGRIRDGQRSRSASSRND